MSISYCHDAARLVELAFAKETTYGTFVTPATQIMHEGVRWGRAHVPAQATSATSTTQLVVHNKTMRGIDFPFVELTAQFGPSTRTILSELMTGSELASNEWLINDFPNSYSVGVNVQRSGGNSYWKFSGCYMGSSQLNLVPGQAATISQTLAATSLVDPQTAPTTFPTLVPASADDGYILSRCVFKHSASDSFSTSIPIMGFSIGLQRTLIIDHASESTEPHCITPSTFLVGGTLNFKYSSDLEGDFQDVWAKEADGGYVTRYLDFVLTSGATTHRITMPVRMDVSGFDASNLEDGVTVPVNFEAGASDAAASPTTPTFRVKDTA